MPKANVEDVEIYYEVHGEGTPVLFVAGLGGTGSYWAPQIGPFSDRFRVVVHDHRGTGQSTHDERGPGLHESGPDDPAGQQVPRAGSPVDCRDNLHRAP